MLGNGDFQGTDFLALKHMKYASKNASKIDEYA